MKRHTYVFATLLAIGVTFLAQPAFAFELFPGETAGMQDFRQYVLAFYNFSIAAGILIATILIMIGGMIWVTSAGNPGRIELAKSYIIDSIIGVILLLGAVVILRVINPALVDLPKINPAPLAAIGSCVYTDPKSYTRCESVPEISCKETLKGTWKSATSCNTVCPLKQPPNPSKPGECGASAEQEKNAAVERARFCAQFSTSGDMVNQRVRDAGRYETRDNCRTYCDERSNVTDVPYRCTGEYDPTIGANGWCNCQ
jgi:hypothetical protein